MNIYSHAIKSAASVLGDLLNPGNKEDKSNDTVIEKDRKTQIVAMNHKMKYLAHSVKNNKTARALQLQRFMFGDRERN